MSEIEVFTCDSLSSPAFILLTRAQKLLMASGGKPLLLSAVKVKRRGSSQSLQTENISYRVFIPENKINLTLLCHEYFDVIIVSMAHPGCFVCPLVHLLLHICSSNEQ